MGAKKRSLDRGRLLVDFLRRRGSASRIELARAFGMNPSTISVTVSSLLEGGMVRELPSGAERARAGTGRPEVGLEVRPEATHLLGLEFDREQLNAVITDLVGTVVHRTSADLRRADDADACLKTLIRTARRLVHRAAEAGRPVEGVGVGAPGRVDFRWGTASGYPGIAGWDEVPVRRRLSEALDLPVYVDNNANCFALGEAWHAEHWPFRRVAVVLMRTGVGLGLAEERRLPLRAMRSAGELGHTVIRAGGTPCACGRRGCLEATASGAALRRRVVEHAAGDPSWWDALKREWLQADEAPGGVGVESLCRAAEAGEPFLEEVLRTMFADLACATENAVRLYAPDLIVIQGRFNGPLMASMLQDAEAEEADRSAPCRRIVSSHPESIGATGAALLAAERLYAPLPEPESLPAS